MSHSAHWVTYLTIGRGEEARSAAPWPTSYHATPALRIVPPAGAAGPEGAALYGACGDAPQPPTPLRRLASSPRAHPPAQLPLAKCAAALPPPPTGRYPGKGPGRG